MNSVPGLVDQFTYIAVRQGEVMSDSALQKLIEKFDLDSNGSFDKVIDPNKDVL